MRLQSPRRLADALNLGFAASASKGTHALLDRAPGSVWVASGLTSVAAECGRFASAHLARRAAFRLTPTQFCTEATAPLVPVLVSYKGRNHDIKTSVAALSGRDAIVVCGQGNAPVIPLLGQAAGETGTVLLPEHTLDREFVASRATLAISAACISLAIDRLPSAEDIDRLVNMALATSLEIEKATDGFSRWHDRQLIVLGSLSAQPALLAWERGLAEASIATTAVADLKDFSHGRYLAPARRGDTVFVVLGDPLGSSMWQRSAEQLSKIADVVVAPGAPDPLENMLFQIIVALLVVERMAASLGLDPRRPPKPAAARHWTYWGQIPVRDASMEDDGPDGLS